MPLSASLAPEVQRVRARITRDVGIEDLTVADRSFRGDNNANIRFWGVAYSWIRNVESVNVSGRHIQLTKAFRCEVRDSYVHHAHNYMPGANAYGISIENQTTESLVENSIIYYLNGGLMIGTPGRGTWPRTTTSISCSVATTRTRRGSPGIWSPTTARTPS